MRKILIAIVAVSVVSVVGFSKMEGAQQRSSFTAMTGAKADEVRQEIVRLEADKLAAFLKNGDVAAGWIQSHDSDDIVEPREDGVQTVPKNETSEMWKKGVLFLISEKQSGNAVDVYENGNTAVCSYYADSTYKIGGKSVPVKTGVLDVWSKFPDGSWRRIVTKAVKVVSIP